MSSRQLLENTARNYFGYLARSFPVMSASDEFDFLPRSEEADKYYDRLENLGQKKVEEHIYNLRDFRNEFRSMMELNNDLSSRIDLELLEANINGALIELEHVKSWKHNPLLYLKIAFIGLDHSLTKPFSTIKVVQERFRARLSEIPRLLKQGVENLENIPESYHRAALAMVADAKEYLEGILGDPKIHSIPDIFEQFEKVTTSLNQFRKFLQSLKPVPDGQINVSTFEDRVKKHFAVQRPLDEIFELAKDEWERVLRKLQKVARAIQPGKTWREIYQEYSPFDTFFDTHFLYGNEIAQLREHLRESDFLEYFPDRVLELCETPTYLRSVRSSASFSAPFSSDPREKAYFYITSRKFDGNKKVHDEVLKRLHKEYRFLTAHETYPGHHLLDTFRRESSNLIRRQIESPLFYEGWAYYAESIPIETGYIEDPVEILVDLKRQLWRSARCQIDVGLATGRLRREKAVELLRFVNFSKEEALAQVNRFGLNPGYQLCYSLGRYEINILRKKYEPVLGARMFHQVLLKGGELPFHLADLNLKHSSETHRKHIT